MTSPRRNEATQTAAAHKQIVERRLNLGPALGLLLGITALYFGRGVLIPVSLSLLLSFLLAPPMVYLQRRGLGKTFSALLVLALWFSALGFTGWMVLGQVLNLTSELPQYRQNIRSKLRFLNSYSLSQLGQTKQLLGEVSGELLKPDQPAQKPLTGGIDGRNAPRQPIAVQIREPEPTPFQFLENTAGSVFQFVATAFVVIIFAIFMLLGREDLRDRVLRLGGSGRLHVTTQALDDAATRVSRYLLMQFAVNASYGALVGLGLFLIGVPHPLIWAIVAAVLRFILHRPMDGRRWAFAPCRSGVPWLGKICLDPGALCSFGDRRWEHC